MQYGSQRPQNYKNPLPVEYKTAEGTQIGYTEIAITPPQIHLPRNPRLGLPANFQSSNRYNSAVINFAILSVGALWVCRGHAVVETTYCEIQGKEMTPNLISLNSSAAGGSILLKFGTNYTEFNHDTADTPQTFKVKGSNVKVTT